MDGLSKFRSSWLLLVGSFPFLVAASALALPQGPGDLLVAPTRIVFEGRQRTAEITLVNLGETPATYRISFVELRMDEFGGTAELDPSSAEPGEQFASKLIRYSPRQVSLEPRVAQTIRLQLRKGEALADGEYRSHLLFRAVPEGILPPEGKEEAPALVIDLKAIYGVSIPVIVRQGETHAEASLEELEWLPSAGNEPPSLRFHIRRSGDRSLYGNLVATFVDHQGKSWTVGVANGVAVYSPNAERTVGLTLQIPPSLGKMRGTLRLVYEAPGHEILAESHLSLQ